MTTPTLQKSISLRAWAELLLLALIWGGSFLSIRVALNEIGPLTVVAHRVVWAALLLWAYVFWRGLRLPRDPEIWVGFLGMGLLNNVIPFSLMAWGQQHIETGLTAILNAGTAIFGVVAAAIFLADERLTPRRALGTAFGFAGVATAVGLDQLRTLDLRSLGQIAVIGGTVSYALAGVWARKRLANLPPPVAAAGMLTAASMIMLPAAWIVEGPLVLPRQPATWAAISYYAVVATAFAYLLYYRVLAMAGSGNLMLVTLLIAPVAILLGALVLKEALPPHAFMGFALLATGLLILNRRAPAPTAPPAGPALPRPAPGGPSSLP
ncbi:DMT family transporter [Loktanella sp. DJP18]|uniref:DMT family transporter n=1 Tax=Loktanella sp. DJP18 TaxID=3409788 RepID=UPI003BB6AA8F